MRHALTAGTNPIWQYAFYVGAFNSTRAIVQSTYILYLVEVLRLPLSLTAVLLAVDLTTTLALEVPTGVFADAHGRRASFLLACATSALGCALYAGAGFPFIATTHSAVLIAAISGEMALSLSFCFYSGALDAWIVDELTRCNSQLELRRAFARGQFWKNIAYLIFGVLGAIIYFRFRISHPPFNIFLIAGVLSLLICLHAYFFMSETPDGTRQPRLAPFSKAWLTGLKFDGLPLNGLGFARDSRLQLLMLASAGSFSLLQLLAYYWPYYLTREIVSGSGSNSNTDALFGLAVSWALAYGARAVGNLGASQFKNSLVAPMVLCGAALLGAVSVAGLVVLPAVLFENTGVKLVTANLLYSLARFSDGLGEPLRQWVLAKFSDPENRATLFSLASFVSLAVSTVIVLGASALLENDLTVSHIFIAGAGIQLVAVPIYSRAVRWGIWHERWQREHTK